MHPDPNPTLFTPAPDQVEPLLHSLLTEDTTLASLAARHGTSVEALSLWMTSPDIRARLESTDAATCWRTRLLASGNVGRIIPALTRILDAYRALDPIIASHHAAPASSQHPSDALRWTFASLRAAESTRRAAQLLLRLCTLPPTTYPQRTTSAPALSAHPPSQAPERPQPVAQSESPRTLAPTQTSSSPPTPETAAALFASLLPTPTPHPPQSPDLASAPVPIEQLLTFLATMTDEDIAELSNSTTPLSQSLATRARATPLPNPRPLLRLAHLAPADERVFRPLRRKSLQIRPRRSVTPKSPAVANRILLRSPPNRCTERRKRAKVISPRINPLARASPFRAPAPFSPIP